MKAATLLLVALVLTGCNSPGVLKPLPFPEVLPVKCSNGHYMIRNNVTQQNPCP